MLGKDDVNFTTAASEDAAQPLSLEEFCEEIDRALDSRALHAVPRHVAGLMADLLVRPRLLTPAQRNAPSDGYGRNPVFICPRDKFSVLAMVWPAGVTTPIHDHRDWCTLGLYEGVIEETWYSPASAAPDCTTAVAGRTVTHRRGDISHMSVDGPNIHKMHNPTDAVAISIHVYGGNFETLGPNLDRIYTLE